MLATWSIAVRKHVGGRLAVALEHLPVAVGQLGAAQRAAGDEREPAHRYAGVIGLRRSENAPVLAPRRARSGG